MKYDECANFEPIDREQYRSTKQVGDITNNIGIADMEGYRSQGEPYDVELTRDEATVTARVWDMPVEMRCVDNFQLISDGKYDVRSAGAPAIETGFNYLYLWGYEDDADDRVVHATFPTVEAAHEYFEHITALIDMLNTEYASVPSFDAEKVRELINDVIDDAQNVTACYEWGTGVGSARRTLNKSRNNLLTALGLDDA